MKAEAANLEVLGALEEDGDSVYLLGPGAGFWAAFAGSKEYTDGASDPLDRWSKRVIGALAHAWGGTAVFPSDGPPYPPFLDWATRSGQAWVSPVGLMIHARAGLWLSFRGAVRVSGGDAQPQSHSNPCETCRDQPCLTACPVAAMAGGTYDVGTCHAWLNQPEGDCMTRGCAVRRACPVSQSYGRVEAQSEFHMKAFHRQ